MKYFFQSISWNTYFTIVLLCKLPINMHDILFEAFHEIWKFWKSISRIFSIVKVFLIEFAFMYDCFVINDVCKNLKEHVNIKVKSKHKVVFRTLHWQNRKVDWSSIFRIMNEKDFNFDANTRFQMCKVRGGMKNCFCFSLFWKNNWHLKAATGSCSVKRVFWSVLLPRNSRCCG